MRHQLRLSLAGEPLTLTADRARIDQLVANLLSNAIKYSPAGGIVTIHACARGGVARVSVSDPGVGIPSEQQDEVFDRFFRVDSSDTRTIGGTGLGLAICLEIVAAHAGRIGFESTRGRRQHVLVRTPGHRHAGDDRGERACRRRGREELRVSLLTPPARQTLRPRRVEPQPARNGQCGARTHDLLRVKQAL